MPLMQRLNGRFFAVLTLFVGAVFVVYREDVLGAPLASLSLLTARTVTGLLEVLGMDVLRQSTVLSHSSGVGYEIYYRCTGVLPIAFLTVLILAYQASWRWKLWGLAAGVPTLLLLNLVRLVHLFYVLVYHRALFHIAHAVVWEGIIILAIVAIWLAWVARAGRPADRNEGRRGAWQFDPARSSGMPTPTLSRASPARSYFRWSR